MARVALLVLALLLVARSASAQSFALGEAVYEENCAVCHGQLIDAPGPTDDEAGAIPAYYQGHNYLLAVPPETLRAAVLYGVPGAGMQGFGGAISDLQLESLIGYIESFRD